MTYSDKKSFLQITYVNKVDIANLNSGEGGGGNITPLKKIQTFEGDDYVYVSGQALRRYIKETMLQLGVSITGVDEKGEPFMKDIIEDGGIKDMKKLYELCTDLDLFGYMTTKQKQGSSRRWSPVKVSPMISMLPYKNEKDFLTRKQATEDKSSGNIVQIEIDTFNFMRGSIIVDIDKIGKDIGEFTYQVKEDYLTDNERKERINSFIEAIKNLNGGSKQARLLQDISPKFVVAINQKTANPFLLTTPKVTESGELNMQNMLNVISDNKEIIEHIFIGITDERIFKNYDEIRQLINNFSEIDIKFTTVNEALNTLKLQ